MNPHWLALYHRLPAPVRSLAASLRGYQLRSWRYDANTEKRVAELLRDEYLSQEQWRVRQTEALARVLHRAATQVPYYREHWAARRRKGDRVGWEQLENWPLLEKETLRQHAQAFIADDCRKQRLFHDHTSGTTGKSLDLWFTRATVKQWYALAEARWRRWYDVSQHDRWGILGGQLVTPITQRQPPFWVWNQALRQLYLSSYHLAPDLLPAYLDALLRYGVIYLLGYPSALFTLAQGALRLNRRVPLKVVIANAEPLFDSQRAVIAEAFQCPVRETYGMAEVVAAASECNHGSLHLWPEVGWLELFAGNQAVTPGTAGELVCTSLLNQDMPLIRYRVGDRAALLPDTALPCACGRTLPRLASLEGRSDDVLYTPDGRRIGRLDPIFKANLPIKEAQIIQESLRCVRIRYVPAPEFTSADGVDMKARLRERMGEIEVILEAVETLPRTANGKLRAVICQLTPAELALAQAAAAAPSETANASQR
jgi:phenylacetate-CoA ligase